MRYQLFQKHPEVEYLATKGSNDRLNEIIRWQITKQDSLTYDGERAKKIIEQELAKPSNAAVRVISSQEFVWPNHADRGVVADLLKEQFNPDKIIVCLRRQQSWFSSQYYEERKKGTFRLYSPTPHGLEKSNPVTLAEWYDIRREMEPYQPLLTRLDYWPLLKRYCDVFGKDRVGLFFYEDLVADNFEFARSLFHFIGVSENDEVIKETLKRANARLDEVDLRAKEISDRFPNLVKLGKIIPFKRKVLGSSAFAKLFLFRSSEPLEMKLRPDQEEDLKKICSGGNRAIADFFGVDIRKKGVLV